MRNAIRNNPEMPKRLPMTIPAIAPGASLRFPCGGGFSSSAVRIVWFVVLLDVNKLIVKGQEHVPQGQN